MPADEPVTNAETPPGTVLAVPGVHPGTGQDEPNGLFAGPNDDPDRFELLGRGLRGGEGIVWRARYRGHLANPVTYAIKQLEPPPQAGPGWPTPADERRWQDVRHLLQTVDDDHLVHVHDVFLGPAPHLLGSSRPARDGRQFAKPYLVMEWIDGPTLSTRIRDGDASLDERLGYVADIAGALQALQSATRTSGNPLLHRDVKPANCIVHSDRGAVLVDLGTVRATTDGHDPLGWHTPLYAAPEVLADPRAPRDPASDRYALGAVAYFCLTGTDPPAAGETGADTAVRQQLENALRRLRAYAPRTLAAHLQRMLAASPAARPGNAVEWATAARALSAPPAKGKRRRRIVAGIATAIAVATTGVAYQVLRPDAAAPPRVDRFTAFGDQYVPFPVEVGPDRVSISPPTGDNRYSHLWGVFAPGEACATTVEFDVQLGGVDPTVNYGMAVAPRSALDADREPYGYSVHYEWQASDINDRPGAYLRPAQLPGGAWVGTIDPTPGPDISRPHHVRISGIGTSLRMTVDTISVAYDLPEVECGGVTIRAWGAPVSLTNLRITAS